MAEEPLHVHVLRVLVHRVDKRRTKYLEQMAEGLPHERYERLVGQAKECRVMLQEIDELLIAIRKGEIEEDDDEAGTVETDRTGRKQNRARTR